MKQEHDFTWTDRSHAEAMAEKHGGVLLAFVHGPEGEEDWVPAEDTDNPQDWEVMGWKVIGWGVSGEDGLSMLDENEEWCLVG